MEIPKVAIVGRPNVGKSTLFNRLCGERKAITSGVPKTTRDRETAQISWDGKNFLLFDTAGILLQSLSQNDQIDRSAQNKIIESLDESDMILFVIDGKCGVTMEDREIGNNLRKYHNKVILVINKADDLKQERNLNTREVNFKETIYISAISGRRCGNLLDLITKYLPRFTLVKQKMPVLTIIGRPNVGKSTLLNTLVGKEISITSGIPGTTRDAVEAQFKNNKGQKFLILDTAGYRRRGRIKPGIEKFSIFRTLDAIVRSDLVIIVTDASEGITRQDAQLVQLALDHKKKVITVINKIDLLSEATTENINNYYRFGFIGKHPVVGISALNQNNINLLLKEVERVLF